MKIPNIFSNHLYRDIKNLDFEELQNLNRDIWNKQLSISPSNIDYLH